MKVCTVPALFCAALFSVLVAVPFLPLAREQSGSFALEARLSANAAGHIQVYYDLGSGWSEAHSSRTAVVPGDVPVTHRLSLPAGTIRALRFDPLDGPGTISIESLRIVSHRGRILRDVPLSALTPAWQIASLDEQAGRLRIVTTADANDPQLAIVFSPPLKLQPTWRERLAGLPVRAIPVFLVFAAFLFALDRFASLRRRCAAIAPWLLRRPCRAIAIVSGVAAVASMYPVVFLGKSYVSPNLGTVLLYESMPTLPGYSSTETSDVKGADIGAVMWWHLPLSILQHRALFRDGELPLWNRYNSAGTPLLGQGQSMFGDPLHFPVIAANGAAWAWDLKYLLAKWLFALGLGLSVFRLVTRSPDEAAPISGSQLWPAAIVSAAAPFIGFFLYRFNHPAFFSVCYAPWPLYYWLRVAQANGWRSTVRWALGLVIANFALMTSGTAKEAYMLLFTMNFSGACVLLVGPAPGRLRVLKFALLAWTGLLFILMSAPLWGTFLHALSQAHTAYNAPSAYQIQPSLILGAFDEIFYRPLMPAGMTFNPSVNFVIFLGLLYFLASFRAQFSHPAAIALAASSLVPLGLAFGLVPPDWIVRIPFLGNVAHIDNTFSCALIVLWSVLAGLGFFQAARRLGTADGKGDLVVAALMLFAVIFAWIAFRQVVHRPIHGPTFTVNQTGQPIHIAPFLWGYLASLLVACAVAAFVFRRALTRKVFTAPLSILAALCFLVCVWRHGLHARAMGFHDYTARPTVRTDFHAPSAAVEFARATQATAPSRGVGLRGNFFPGWTGVYGLETIHGADPLVNPFYRELTGVLPGVQRLWDWRLYLEPATTAAARPYLDALNVRYYFDLKSDQALLGRSLELALAADLDVYESPTVWPRAFFTDRVQEYDEVADFVRLIGSGDGRPFAAVQRSDASSHAGVEAFSGAPDFRTVIPATDYRLTENTTSFRVRASSPGVIVLTETFVPNDFQARLNGQPVPIHRLNHAFRGIVVASAGEYELSFRYRAQGFDRNLLIAVMSFLLLGATIAVIHVMSRRAHVPTSTPRVAPARVEA